MPDIPVEITRLDTVDSTNRALAELIRLGAPAGSAVVASSQTAGRGQRGREWFSPAGFSLYVSYSWSLKSGPEGLAFAAGLACARALRESTGAPACVRWPNDIIVNGRKAGGVLIESSLRAQEWVVGCGLNINNPAFPSPLEGIATSTLLETGRECPLNEVEDAFFRHTNAALDQLQREGFDAVLRAWREFDVTPGSRLRVHEGGEDRIVEAVRVNDDGNLITRSGERFELVVGASSVEWMKD